MNVHLLENNTILIIHQNDADLNFILNLLTELGFQPVMVRSFEDAMVQVELNQPSLIFVDIARPEQDGLEICHRLTHWELTQDIPVILLIAFADADQQVIRGFQAGAVDYVIKPIHAAEVVARLSTHLTIRKLQKQLNEQNQLLRQLQTTNEELQRLATLDDLTQLANRRQFDTYLEEQWQQLTDQPLSLILFDVDCFKLYNDTYGHVAGDFCLQQVAHSIQIVVEKTEFASSYLAARYGGEEFTVILPNILAESAIEVAEQVRLQVSALKIAHATSSVGPYLTISCGISSTILEPDLGLEDLLKAADKALYQAKNQGRNCSRFQAIQKNASGSSG